MGSELMPPFVDTAPHLPPETTAVDSVRIWIDLMKSADKLVQAGLSREVGPNLAKEAYRCWCSEQFARHGAHMVALAGTLRAAGDCIHWQRDWS